MFNLTSSLLRYRLKRAVSKLQSRFWSLSVLHQRLLKKEESLSNLREELASFDENNAQIISRLDNVVDDRQYAHIFGPKYLGIILESLLGFKTIIFLASEFGMPDLPPVAIFGGGLLLGTAIIQGAQNAMRQIVLGARVRQWSSLKKWGLIIALHSVLLILPATNVFLAYEMGEPKVLAVLAVMTFLYQLVIVHLWDRYFDADVEWTRRCKVRSIQKQIERQEIKLQRQTELTTRNWASFQQVALTYANVRLETLKADIPNTVFPIPNYLTMVVNRILGHSLLPFLANEDGTQVIHAPSARDLSLLKGINRFMPFEGSNNSSLSAGPDNLQQTPPNDSIQGQPPSDNSSDNGHDEHDPDQEPEDRYL